MKRSWVGVILLCSILMMNIVFTQFLVHQFYYENYERTILYTLINLLLFPAALFIYKKEKRRGVKNEDKK
jgi:membrane protease YdiL (CAAX protease family)